MSRDRPPRRPPRISRWLLGRLLPSRHRRFILDDLDEEFRRFQLPRRGRAGARRWYRSQVLQGVLPALRMRLRRRRRRDGAPAPRGAGRAVPRRPHRATRRRTARAAPPADRRRALEGRTGDGSRRSPGSTTEKALAEGRQALRRLARSPGFTVAAVLTLGVGVGATVAVFSLVNGILLQPLPYGSPQRLVTVHHRAPGLDLERAGLSWGTYFHYLEHAEALDAIGLYQEATVHLGDASAEPRRIRLAMVTPSLLSVLARGPLLGRSFGPDDAVEGSAPVALISHDLWRRRYGGDPGIVGGSLDVNRRPREIVGVMPADFRYPGPDVEVWLPLAPPRERGFGGFFLEGVGRLAPGVSAEEAEAELEGLVPSLADAYDDVTPAVLRSSGFDAVVTPLRDAVVGDVGTALWILMGAVGMLLLIACANIANLTLLRAEYRQGEVAMRRALGAGLADVAAFFVAESALVGLAGSLLGLGLSVGALELLARLPAASLPRLHEVGIDGAVLAFTCAVTVAAVAAFGLAPLVRVSGRDLPRTLRGEGRLTAGRRRQRVRRGLVMVQVALALTLLVGSGLMVRSLLRLQGVDPGFTPDGVLTLNVTLPFRPYPDFDTSAGFFRDLVERLEVLPGVEAAGSIGDVPLGPSAFVPMTDPLSVEGRPLPEGEIPPIVEYQQFLPGYFETLRIPLEAGRWIARGERAGRDNPVLISEAAARRLFPGEDPVGRRVVRGSGPPDDEEGRWMTVVGVVGDVRNRSLEDPPGEIVYLPVLDRSVDAGLRPGAMDVVVRTGGMPSALAPVAREVVHELDPVLPVAEVRPLERIVAASTARTRLTMALLLLAAGAALLMGAVGMYGVISHAVSQRMGEIGVRMALGARPTDVRRMIVAEAVVVIAGGLVLGLGSAVAASRLLSALLFEVAPTDVATYVAVIGVLSLVAGLATWIPARRAGRVDPLVALRER